MKTTITSWRKLWKEELPFYQIELAPFEGFGITGARKYALLRHQQAKAASQLNDVTEICILDAGERMNIHPRRKKMVGERLGRIVMRNTYGDESLTAYCPRAVNGERSENEIVIRFENAAEGMVINGELDKYLFLKAEEKEPAYEAFTEKDRLILKGSFRNYTKIIIEYCETNYCEAVLFNSEGNPAFGFTLEV